MKKVFGYFGGKVAFAWAVFIPALPPLPPGSHKRIDLGPETVLY